MFPNDFIAYFWPRNDKKMGINMEFCFSLMTNKSTSLFFSLFIISLDKCQVVDNRLNPREEDFLINLL